MVSSYIFSKYRLAIKMVARLLEFNFPKTTRYYYLSGLFNRDLYFLKFSRSTSSHSSKFDKPFCTNMFANGYSSDWS